MLGLLLTFSKESCVLIGQFLLLFGTLALESMLSALSLNKSGRDQTLNSRSLSLRLLSFLGGQWSTNNILADVIFLRKVEELSDLIRSLRSETSGNGDVSQAFDFLGA